MEGISLIQGGHQIAQKFTRTTFPKNLSNPYKSPSRELKVKSGAFFFSGNSTKPIFEKNEEVFFSTKLFLDCSLEISKLLSKRSIKRITKIDKTTDK